MAQSLATSRVEKWYAALVKIFVFIAIILIGVIVYVSFTKTTVTITTQEQDEVLTAETTVAALDGVVLLTDVEGSLDYGLTAPTEEAAAEEVAAEPEETVKETEEVAPTKPVAAAKAKGSVKIVNKYTKDQPLITNTRLLSKDGVLFRTQKTVTVPAGGEVTVDVLADAEGAKGNVGATTFEVVALWAGLKDKIYAESSAAMTGGADTSDGSSTTTATTTTTTATDDAEDENAVTITQNDIANAREKLETMLFEQANERFATEMKERTELQELGYIIKTPIVVKRISESRSADAGTKAISLTLNEKVTVGSVALDKTKLEAWVKEEITTQTNSEELAENVNLDDVIITLSEINDTGTDGSITATITVKQTLTTDDEKIAPSALTGKTAEEVQEYLLSFDEIKTVDVKISPFWATRTPSLAKSITVELKKNQ
jgi:hypothetical protein